jgi:hypothetical protein
MTLAERRIDATDRSASCEMGVSARDDQALTVAVRGDLDFAVQRAVRTALMGIVVPDRPTRVSPPARSGTSPADALVAGPPGIALTGVSHRPQRQKYVSGKSIKKCGRSVMGSS